MRDKGEIAIYKKANGYVGKYYDTNGKRKAVSAKTREEIQKRINKELVEMKER